MRRMVTFSGVTDMATWEAVPCERAKNKGYTLRAKQGDLGLLYQLTKGSSPPPDEQGGYYKLYKLLT